MIFKRVLPLILILGFPSTFFSQNLHVESNAASIENEANATTGWIGDATITSDGTDAQSGSFSIRAVSTSANGRILEYYFDAVVGEDYVIRIWAKEGPKGTVPGAPAFAAWAGMAGFSVTEISGTEWAEYVFNVRATTSRPRIRVYTSPSSTSTIAGNTVLIDAVSIVVAGSDTEAPSAVTDLSSSNTTSTGTDLTWSASTDNIGVTNYEVFRDGVSIANTGTATTFNVTGLSPETSYNFTVFAEDAAGNTSTVSNTVNVNTLAGTDTEAPSAVTDLGSSNTTSTGTDLTWSASTDNIGVTNYEVFRDGVSIANTGTTTTFNVTGLSPETSYNFTVFAEDAAGNTSAVSNTETVNTLAAPDTEAPSAVTDLSSSNTTSTGTDLAWSASTDNVGVTNYEVFRDGVSIANTGTTTTFNVIGLSPSTSYDFTVFAEDAAGNTSAVSNTETVNTPGVPDTEAPSAVTDLGSSNTTSTGTDLTWSASTDNIGVTNYEVFRDGVSIANTGTTTTFNVTGLSPETSYDFTVFAEDAAGNTSAVSNTETVNTLAAPDTEAPSAVTDLSSSNTTSTGTDLAWSASTDNVGVTNYEVFRDGVSIANTGAATTFNVTGLSPSTSYNFTVFAEDAAGNTSAVSNTETVNTPAVPDTEAPSAITDLGSSNTTSTGTSLSWSASTDNVGVTNYEVFRDGVSIGSSGTATTFNVTGLTPSTSYDFTVFAEDLAGNTSTVSNTETVTTSAGGGVVDYTSENSNLTTVDWTARDLFADRNVGIGTTDTQGYRLAVAGNVIAEGVRVELQGNWPDFVFHDQFDLLKLEEIRKYIQEHGHLPNIPSAKQIEEEGIDLGTMNAKLLQKIEELTLYVLSQNDEIKELKEENEKMKDLLKRLERIEKKLDVNGSSH
ncbi:fibronectin type III domain-containing protein [Flagellimonas sp.]|uniref:fibronectin type III domain-containing protein n=1 Tax=Flagellimonas sp. TaxID=2058762 RepID=UPI003BAC1A4C